MRSIAAMGNHPAIDADGHMIETTFALLDFVALVGGAKIAAMKPIGKTS